MRANSPPLYHLLALCLIETKSFTRNFSGGSQKTASLKCLRTNKSNNCLLTAREKQFEEKYIIQNLMSFPR